MAYGSYYNGIIADKTDAAISYNKVAIKINAELIYTMFSYPVKIRVCYISIITVLYNN